MTENERKAIDVLKDMIVEGQYNGDVIVARDDEEELKTAIQALEEIQRVKEIISSFPLDCGSTAEDIREIYRQLRGYLQIGTIEEFKALKEKSVAKKPNQVSRAMDKDKFVGLIGRCPNCGSIVAEDNFVCEDCFQVLDWE